MKSSMPIGHLCKEDFMKRPDLTTSKVSGFLWREPAMVRGSASQPQYACLQLQFLQPGHDGVGKRLLVLDEAVPFGVGAVRIRQRHELDVWH